MFISQVIDRRTSTVVEAPDLLPEVGKCVVEVLVSGVCTSEVAVWRDFDPTASPLRLGHEIVGRVIAPSLENSRWRVGDVVTGFAATPGYATQVLMEDHRMTLIPGGVDPAACMGEPVSTLSYSVDALRLGPSSRVAVVGLGFMGLNLLQIAKAKNPGLLVAVDPNAPLRELALRLGADEAYHPHELPESYVNGPASGLRGDDARMSAVFEVTGKQQGLDTAASMTAKFAELSIVGYHHYGDPTMSLDLWYKSVTIHNGFCPDPDVLFGSLVDAVSLIERRKINMLPLITHRIPLEGIDDAFSRILERQKSHIKSVVVPNPAALEALGWS